MVVERRGDEAMSRRWLGGVAAALSLVAALAGCAGTANLGQPPNYAGLEQLTRGKSTEADVRRILGEPFGRGAMQTGKVSEPRTVWSYEHTEAPATRGEIQVGLLLVFLHGGYYDGHLWFSSTSLLENRL